jgi:hypothetical protein
MEKMSGACARVQDFQPGARLRSISDIDAILPSAGC